MSEIYIDIYSSVIGSQQPPGVITTYDCFRLAGILFIAAMKYRNKIPVTFNTNMISSYICNEQSNQRSYIFVACGVDTLSMHCFEQHIYGFALVEVWAPDELVIDLIEAKPGFGSKIIASIVQAAKTVFHRQYMFGSTKSMFECKYISLNAIPDREVISFYKTKNHFRDDKRSSSARQNRRIKQEHLVPLIMNIKDFPSEKIPSEMK